uniref:Uncharacterized protein n=1 Tax=Strigamia maritima TaxID=126957 RepID=T1IVQ3_STRMM
MREARSSLPLSRLPKARRPRTGLATGGGERMMAVGIRSDTPAEVHPTRTSFLLYGQGQRESVKDIFYTVNRGNKYLLLNIYASTRRKVIKGLHTELPTDSSFITTHIVLELDVMMAATHKSQVYI